MALTMTRTRTQTTLTRLAKLLSDLNGELEFVCWLQSEPQEPYEQELLTRRRGHLAANRDAVVATLRQFDPALVVEAVGSARHKRSRHAVQRYMARLKAVGAIPNYLRLV